MTTTNTYGLPCAWHYDPDHDITVRWGRPDGHYTVHHGDQRGHRTNTALLDTVRVGTPWIDDYDLTQAARDWTRAHPPRRRTGRHP